MLRREMEKLERSLGGIKDMNHLPDALFVIDVGHEKIAISEAGKLGIRSSVWSIPTTPPWVSIMSFPAMMTRSAPFSCMCACRRCGAGWQGHGSDHAECQRRVRRNG